MPSWALFRLAGLGLVLACLVAYVAGFHNQRSPSHPQGLLGDLFWGFLQVASVAVAIYLIARTRKEQ